MSNKVSIICTKCGAKVKIGKKAYEKRTDADKQYCSNCLRKKTNLAKYGVTAPAKCSVVQAKYKAAMLDKYGVENAFQSEEVKNKIKQTMLEKHGVENISQSDYFKDKYKATMLDKYGVENGFQSKEIKNKIRQTSLKKYGATSAMKNKHISTKSRTQYVENYSSLLTKRLQNNNIEMLDTYMGSRIDGVNEYYTFKCTICGTEFQDYLNGHIPQCPTCFPKKEKSKGEVEIADFLIAHGVEVQMNDRTLINPFEIDIVCPKEKIGIEFNGIYWHSLKDKNYHLSKTIKMEKKGYRLLHIFEDEWVLKQEIVKSILKNYFNIKITTIYARKCKIKLVSNDAAKVFFNETHLQGYIASQYHIGLYFEDELMCCMSLSKSRFTAKYDWEVMRFSTKLNCRVLGGFSKLFAYFETIEKGIVVSYADRRYFTGKSYESANFKFSHTTKPSYFYVKNKMKRYNRYNFQKHKLKDKLKSFDVNKTEKENMFENGYNQLYDCGTNCYIKAIDE